MVIYDYNKTGKEIVRQETIHEYKERMATFVKGRKRAKSISKVNSQWDMTRCKKQAELRKNNSRCMEQHKRWKAKGRSTGKTSKCALRSISKEIIFIWFQF